MPFSISLIKHIDNDNPQCGCLFNDFLILGFESGKMKIITYSFIEKDTGEYSKVYEAHKDGINGFTIINDKRIISYSADANAFVWEFENNSMKCIHCLHGHTDSITGCLITSYGILTCSEDSTVIVWDENYIQNEVYDCHNEAITSMSLLFDTYLIVSGSESNIKIWNIPGGWNEENLIKDSPKIVTCMNVINNSYSIMGDHSGNLFIYDVNNNWKLIYNSNIHTQAITNIVVIDDIIMTSGLDDNINVFHFDSDSISIIDKIESNYGGITTLLAVSTHTILSCHLNCDLTIYNFIDNTDDDNEEQVNKKRKIESWNNTISNDCDSPVFNIIIQDNYIITSHKDKIIKIWDKKTVCKLIKSYEFESVITAISPFLNNYIICGEISGLITVRDITQNYNPIARILDTNKRISNIQTDNRYIYCGVEDGNFFIYDSQENYKNVLNQICHNQPIISIVLFDDKIMTIGSDGVITSYTRLLKFEYSTTFGISYTCSEVINNSLVTGNKEGNIIIYQLPNLDILKSISCFDAYIFSMCYFEELLFVSGYSCSIRVFDPNNNFNSIMTLGGHFGPVLCLNSDNSILYSGSYDRTIKVWKKNIN